MAADTAVERLTYTPDECAKLLGVSVGSVRDQCRGGRIRAIDWGGRWLIPRDEIERLTGLSLSPPAVESGWAPEREADLREARRLVAEAKNRLERVEALLSEGEGE